MFSSAVIVAAGRGTRVGGPVAKQFLPLGDMPVLAHTLRSFQNCSAVNEIILVASVDGLERCKEIVEQHQFKKVKVIVQGGAERQYSVYRGLASVSPLAEVVLIHDGVRPFVNIEDIEKIAQGAAEHGACLLGVPIQDTIKICDSRNLVKKTPERAQIWAAQTPQGFRKDIIQRAYEKAHEEGILATDDASLVERMSVPVKVLLGDFNNIKITTNKDLALAEKILSMKNRRL